MSFASVKSWVWYLLLSFKILALNSFIYSCVFFLLSFLFHIIFTLSLFSFIHLLFQLCRFFFFLLCIIFVVLFRLRDFNACCAIAADCWFRVVTVTLTVIVVPASALIGNYRWTMQQKFMKDGETWWTTNQIQELVIGF